MKKLIIFLLLLILLPFVSYAQIWEKSGGNNIVEGFFSSNDYISEIHYSPSDSGSPPSPPSPMEQFFYHVRINSYANQSIPEGETRGIKYMGETTQMLPVSVDGNTINNWNDNSNSWKTFVYSIAKPCMLRFDGTVDYYLDPEDQTKKLDGTDSDLVTLASASAYQGDAMVELKPIWISLTTINNQDTIITSNRCEKFLDIKIADHQVDETFFCHAFTREDGSMADRIYVGMYEGSLDGNNRMRSIPCLKEQIYSNVGSSTTIIEACRANGNNYYPMYGSLLTYLQVLHILVAESVDSKNSYGNGHFHNNASEAVDLGLYRNKGCFWGQHDNFDEGVKSFWCENLWGNKAVFVDGIRQSGDYILFSKKPPFDEYEQPNWAMAQYTHTPDIGVIQSIGCYNGFLFPSRVSYSPHLVNEKSSCGYAYTNMNNSCLLQGSYYSNNGEYNGMLTMNCHGFRSSPYNTMSGCRIAYIPSTNN